MTYWGTKQMYTGQIHAPASVPPVPIGYEAGWTLEAVWTLCGRRKSLTLPGMEPGSARLFCL
jgi:hypothetical protein